MVSTVDGRLPPGPRGNLLLGSIQEIRRDNVHAFLDAWRRYGDTVRLRGPVTLYLVAHPDGVKHVLQDNAATTRGRLPSGTGCRRSWATAWWARRGPPGSARAACPSRRSAAITWSASARCSPRPRPRCWTGGSGPRSWGGRWTSRRRWSGSAWPTWAPRCSRPTGGGTWSGSRRP